MLAYEWIRSYGDVTCVIEVLIATDETKDIQTISFYNSPEYSSTNSEMAAIYGGTGILYISRRIGRTGWCADSFCKCCVN